jgi:hypothetical protein
MWWYVRIGYQGGRDGRHGNEKVWAKVCAKARDEPGRRAEGYFLFNVKIQAIELVHRYNGVQRSVVRFKLC